MTFIYCLSALFILMYSILSWLLSIEAKTIIKIRTTSAKPVPYWYRIPQGIDIEKIRLFLFPTKWMPAALPTDTSSLSNRYYLVSFIQYLIMCPLRSWCICLCVYIYIYIYIWMCKRTNGDLLFFRLIFVYASSVYEIEWEAFISNNDDDDRT